MASRIGGRSENQDSCGYADTPIGLLVVVCDGMGGMRGGSTASSLAVSVVINDVKEFALNAKPDEVLRDAVLHANKEVIQTGLNDPALLGMGTTLTAALFCEECVYLTYVGDSRIYQLRGSEKVYRTFDHSMVFQMVKGGHITEEQARNASNSNVILKALGVTEELDVEVTKHSYDKGDRFILCTDGFWGNMPESDFLKYVTKKGEQAIIIERAFGKIERAGAESKQGNHDNLTCAVFDTLCYSKFRTKMEKKLKIASIALAVLLLASVGLNVVQNLRHSDYQDQTTQRILALEREYNLLEEQSRKSQSEADSLYKVSLEASARAEQLSAEASRSRKDARVAREAQKKAEDAEAKAIEAQKSADKDKLAAQEAKRKAEVEKADAVKQKAAAEKKTRDAVSEKNTANSQKAAAEKAKNESDAALKTTMEKLADTQNKLEEIAAQRDSAQKKVREQGKQISDLKKEVESLEKTVETYVLRAEAEKKSAATHDPGKTE